MLLRLRGFAAVGRAATFALARVFGFLSPVLLLDRSSLLRTTLAFARVLALFRFKGLDGNALLGWSAARAEGASCYRPGEKTGDSCTGNNCF